MTERPVSIIEWVARQVGSPHAPHIDTSILTELAKTSIAKVLTIHEENSIPAGKVMAREIEFQTDCSQWHK